MRCHWVRANDVPGGKFHLPGCMGGAVYGPRGCTCPPKSAAKDRKDLERRVTELEQKLERIAAQTANKGT